jgi:hypothetical protein
MITTLLGGAMRPIFYAFVAVVSLSPIISAQGPPKGSSCQRAVEQFVCGAPIILPVAEDKRALTRKDYQLTGLIQGVRFDIDGDDNEEQVAWTAMGSHLALLALDRNGNGKIDNGKELFSNYTFPGAGNGFAALNQEAKRWGNPGMINERSPLYEKLLLWEDENHDGISQPEEIRKFSDHYVGIDGGYIEVARVMENRDPVAIDRFIEHAPLVDKHGNEYRFVGTAAVRDPGKSKHYPMTNPGDDADLLIPIYDVVLRAR